MLHRKFTLLELLVVIAIIMILTSLFLPALGKARNKANAIKCTGNLNQIGKAIYMYSGDYNGCIVNRQFGPNGLIGSYLLLEYLGYKDAVDASSKKTKIFFCPSDKSGYIVYGGTPYGILMSYGLNHRMAYSYPQIGSNRLPRPSQTMLFMDIKNAYLAYGPWDGFSLYGDYLRHGNGINFLMCDSSVKWLRFNDPTLQGNTYHVMFWWGVDSL